MATDISAVLPGEEWENLLLVTRMSPAMYGDGEEAQAARDSWVKLAEQTGFYEPSTTVAS